MAKRHLTHGDLKVCEPHQNSCDEELEIPLNPFDESTFGRERVFRPSQSGNIYHGESHQDQKDGKGVYLYANGDAYAGEWCQNQRHGWGFFIRKVGMKYEGTWSNDEQFGFGLQSQANDMKYMGEFAGDTRHGRGIVVQSNGLLYAGLWQYDEVMSRELLFQNRKVFTTKSRTSDPVCAPTSRKDQMPSFPGLDGSQDSSNTRAATQEQRLIVPEVPSNGERESSPSMTTSSSSTPIFHHLNVTSSSSNGCSSSRDQPSQEDANFLGGGDHCAAPSNQRQFARQFRKVQQMSSIVALGDWTCSDVAHVLYSSGVKETICDLFIEHKVSGKVVFDLVVDMDENLIDVGVKNPYYRRFITIVLTLLLRIRRRCILERTFSYPTTESFLNGHAISPEGLFLERRIGEGGYGRVYKGRYEINKNASRENGATVPRSPTGKRSPSSSTTISSVCRGMSEGSIPVAVKVFRSRSTAMRLRRYQEGSAEVFGRMQKQQKALMLDFYGEVEVLSQLRHPNVTLFFGAVRFPLYCIVTEYVPCGSLFDLLHRHKRQLSLNQMVRIAKELSSTLAYLHSKDVLHCDLKSSNVLLTEIGSVKLCDFGLATCLSHETDYTYQHNSGAGKFLPVMPERVKTSERPAMLGCLGTHQWMSPEVMRGEGSTRASDVYSFGVILWEMLTRLIPYKDMASTHIIAWAGYGGNGPHDHTTEELRRIKKQNALGIFPSMENDPKKPGDQISSCYQVSSRSMMRTVAVSPELSRIPQPIAGVLERCLDRDPRRRPSFPEVSSFFNALHRSSVLNIEENLKSFFGL